MKFKCLKKDIQSVMAITEDIVGGKIVYNIESNVVFALKGNTLTLTATDNSIWVRGELDLTDCEGEGEVAVFAKKIGSIIKEMPDGFLAFDVNEDNKINMVSENGRIRHTIIGISPADFPAYPSVSAGVQFLDVPAKEFGVMIEKTDSATSKETFKPALRGIYFEKEASALHAVATDGKRLAYIERSFENIGGEDFSVIIDPKVLKEVINAADYAQTDNISVGVGTQQVYFKTGRFQFTSNLIEGKFPAYKQVIPSDFDYSFRVNKADLLDALRRVIPMINDIKSRRLIFEVSEGTLRVKGVNREIGESREDIEAIYHGEAQTLILNYMYVQDIIKQLDSDIISFSARYDTSPAMVKEIERTDYFYIVMPMSPSDDSI